MLPPSHPDPVGVLRGASEARFCEVHDLSAAGATLKLTAAPPVEPMLLSFQLGAEHVVVPVNGVHEATDGGVVVTFASVCERRLERLLAHAA